MYNTTWCVPVIFAIPLLAGCAHGLERGEFDTCIAGDTCVLVGRLELFPGEPAGAAILSNGGACANLALPDEFYVKPLLRQWDGKVVRAEGQAFTQPNLETELGALMWYSKKDRKLATGMCSHGLGIYVDNLRSSSGSAWP